MQLLDLFASLPTSISCNILQDWVEIKALGVLDSSYCCKLLRESFLHLIQSDELILHEVSTQKKTFMQWIFKRNVRLRSFSLGSSDTINITEEYLAKYGSFVRKMKLITREDDGDNKDFYKSVANHCHYLTHFQTHNIDIFNANFGKILVQNTNLIELHISCQIHSRTQRPQSATVFDGIELPNLRVLSVQHPNPPSFFLNLLRSTKNVEQLQLSMPAYVNRCFTEAELKQIPQLCLQLRSLGLMKICVAREEGDGNDDNEEDDDNQFILAEVVAACSGLINVRIKNMFITDAAILHIVSNLKNLRSLDIRKCNALTSDSLVHIYTHCAETLTTLQLNMCVSEGPTYDHAALDTLLLRCTALRTLNFGQNTRDYDGHDHPSLYLLPSSISNLTALLLRDDALADANLLSIAKYCPNLEVLSMNCPSFSEEEIPYTFKGVSAIVLGCTRLREVEIDTVCFDCTHDGRPHLFVELAFRLWRELRPRLTISKDYSVFCKYDLLKLPM